MSRANRFNQVEFNFDGLTDSVTNLVGTLILLVVLVMALSRESGGDPQLEAGPAKARPIEELIGRMEAIRSELDAVEKDVALLEQEKIPGLQKRVAKLIAGAGPTKAPASSPGEPPSKCASDASSDDAHLEPAP